MEKNGSINEHSSSMLDFIIQDWYKIMALIYMLSFRTNLKTSAYKIKLYFLKRRLFLKIHFKVDMHFSKFSMEREHNGKKSQNILQKIPYLIWLLC